MRRATEEDIPQLLIWGREFHSHSPYAHHAYSEERTANTLRHMMQEGCVLISDKGMAGAYKVPLWFSDLFYGQEMFWWGDESLREGLEAWAKSEGCLDFSMMCLDNERMPAMARLYRMNGYIPTEHHFMKRL